MDEPRLLERLPLVSVAKLSEVSEGVLFESLPNAPVQQIATQKPPVAEPSLPPPSPVRVTDDESVYRVQDTGERVWVALVASPAPLHSALAKFTRRLTDVEVTVAGLDGPPSGAPDPPGQALSSLFSVTVEGAGPDDISAAHVTVSVEKQWLDDNDIHRWSIQLSRLDEDEGEWVPFPTKQVRDEGGLVFYSAVLPGFSVFAVTGSPELSAQVPSRGRRHHRQGDRDEHRSVGRQVPGQPLDRRHDRGDARDRCGARQQGVVRVHDREAGGDVPPARRPAYRPAQRGGGADANAHPSSNRDPDRDAFADRNPNGGPDGHERPCYAHRDGDRRARPNGDSDTDASPAGDRDHCQAHRHPSAGRARHPVPDAHSAAGRCASIKSQGHANAAGSSRRACRAGRSNDGGGAAYP